MLIVSDTSPISNLLIINRLDILQKLFGEIIIPPTVDAEVRQLKSLGEDISFYESCKWIKIMHPKSNVLLQRLMDNLDAGEAEAIVLAKEINCNLLLMDERRGTRIAKAEGLITIGLLGVLAKAKAENILENVKPILEDLENVAGFWIGATLKQAFLNDHSE